MFKLHNEGFSLVEFLVMVSLVIVLMVVTGSQLMAYNYQSANAAAAADIRNAAAAEKTFYANWGVYASSTMGGMSGPGSVFTSYSNSTGDIWQYGISPTAPSAMIPYPGFQVGVSLNVGLVISTSSMGESYVMVSKDASGDRCFGMDSDATVIYWISAVPGVPMNSTAAPAPMAGLYDLPGVTGMFPCFGNVPNMEQSKWTAL